MQLVEEEDYGDDDNDDNDWPFWKMFVDKIA